MIAKIKRLEALRNRVAEVLSQLDPAVVMVPGWSGKLPLACLEWCIHTSTPAVVFSDSTAWDSERYAVKEWIKRKVVRLFSAGLVAGHPHLDYMVQLGMPAERIFLGYDAVDNGYFSAKAEEVRSAKCEVRSGEQGTKLQARSDLPSAPYFLASARFVEKKNLPRLLQAYARYRTLCEDHRLQDDGQQDNSDKSRAGRQRTVRSQRSVVGSPSPVVSSPVVRGPVVPWDLVLLGDGPLRSSLFALRSSLCLHDHVLLPGFKQYGELPAYYGLASAFVHASTIEQWGLVVNEAMASGLPVLVSNRCGCAMDLVQEGVNGFTFDPYNVEQLANLMLRLTETTDHGPRTIQPKTGVGGERSEVSLEKMGNASREIISQWGPERFAKGLKEAVDCALSVGPVRPTLVQRMILKAMLLR